MRQDFLQNRRSGEFGYHSDAADFLLSQHQQPQDTLDPRLEVRSDILHRHRRRGAGGDWRSVGGGGGGVRYGDVELTDFGLIDYPPPVAPTLKSGDNLNYSKNVNSSSNTSARGQSTSVRKGLLWVQKDRLFSRNRLQLEKHLLQSLYSTKVSFLYILR